MQTQRQAGSSENDLSGRIADALDGKDVSGLARRADVPSSTMHSIMKGAMPKADTAVRIASALGCSVEWLVSGVGARTVEPLRDAAEADWVFLPHYRLTDFTETGKPEPLERMPVRRDWLNRALLTSSNLWLTTMPSGALPRIAAEGDTIVCKDIELPLADGRTYIWLLGGSPVVRQLQIRPRGHFLVDEFGSAATLIEPHEVGDYVPIARVLASITVRPA